MSGIYGMRFPADVSLADAARLVVSMARQEAPRHTWPDVGEAHIVERFDGTRYVLASVRPTTTEETA